VDILYKVTLEKRDGLGMKALRAIIGAIGREDPA